MKMNKRTKRKLSRLLLLLALVLILSLASRFLLPEEGELPSEPAVSQSQSAPSGGEETIPEYAGEPYYVLNGNQPFFTDEEITAEAFEEFSELDELGRCGVVMACVGQELMPTGDRESISHVKPSGWVNVPYEFVDGEYLYNRCHLIGFQLTGENDNECNLITGTRYLNVQGMLPFENMVADYVKETDNHVLYRVTPLFEGEELVARGVQMEAWSVEDEGDGICFNVYIYNVQPGVTIDYATGESKLDEAALNQGEQETFVLNINSKKFHNPECSGAKDMKAENRQDYTGTRDLLVAQGYQPCGVCKP